MSRILMINNQRGLTLVEVIIILFIVSMIILIAIPLYGNSIQNQTYSQVFERFEDDYLYAQQRALTKSERLEMQFASGHYILRQDGSGEEILRRELPEGMSIRTNYSQDKFFLNPNGNISRAGRVFFDYTEGKGQKTQEFTFQLGTGRIHATQ